MDCWNSGYQKRKEWNDGIIVGIKSGKNGMMEWWKEQSFCFHCSQPIIPVFHYSTIPDLAEDLTL